MISKRLIVITTSRSAHAPLGQTAHGLADCRADQNGEKVAQERRAGDEHPANDADCQAGETVQ